MRRLLAIALLAGCGNGGTSNDAGTDASIESGGGDSGNDASSCIATLCVPATQPPQCPSCAPMNGDICSPPAAVTCNWTNGCTGAQLQSAQCTCELPDAGDAGDAANPNAIWSCK